MTTAEIQQLKDLGYAPLPLLNGWHRLVLTPSGRVAECYIRDCSLAETKTTGKRFMADINYLRDGEVPEVEPKYSNSLIDLHEHLKAQVV